jgi:trans-2-enoyl-CoA reductase
MKYKRILLKLSGEALMGSKQFGIDPLVLIDDTLDLIDRSMVVEIIKCSGDNYWYKDKVGEKMIVTLAEGWATGDFSPIGQEQTHCIYKEDCKVLSKFDLTLNTGR